MSNCANKIKIVDCAAIEIVLILTRWPIWTQATNYDEIKNYPFYIILLQRVEYV